jgi:hypothetical protein
LGSHSNTIGLSFFLLYSRTIKTSPHEQRTDFPTADWGTLRFLPQTQVKAIFSSAGAVVEIPLTAGGRDTHQLPTGAFCRRAYHRFMNFMSATALDASRIITLLNPDDSWSELGLWQPFCI